MADDRLNPAVVTLKDLQQYLTAKNRERLFHIMHHANCVAPFRYWPEWRTVQETAEILRYHRDQYLELELTGLWIAYLMKVRTPIPHVTEQLEMWGAGDGQPN